MAQLRDLREFGDEMYNRDGRGRARGEHGGFGSDANDEQDQADVLEAKEGAKIFLEEENRMLGG